MTLAADRGEIYTVQVGERRFAPRGPLSELLGVSPQQVLVAAGYLVEAS